MKPDKWNERYTWTAHGAPWPSIHVVDWRHAAGPRVVGAVPDSDDGIEAARAIVRLMSMRGDE